MLTSQLKVVVLRTVALAKHVKVEPDHARCKLPQRDVAVKHGDVACLPGDASDGLKVFFHACIRRSICRYQEGIHLLKRAQSIVDACINLDHIKVLLQHFDSGQEKIPLQAVRVQTVRRIV